MSISQIITPGARLHDRVRWVMERCDPDGPSPRRLDLMGVGRTVLDHAANIGALLAGAAMLVVAAPFVSVLALAACGAGVSKRRRDRGRGAPRGLGDALAPPPPAAHNAATRLQRRQQAASDHLYFSVRCFASQNDSHILQVAFVDDRGNVVFSAFSRAAGAMPGLGLEPPEDLAAEPMGAGAMQEVLERLCRGAVLVGFGRVLQAGLLPADLRQHVQQVDCAWRRFLRVTRERGLPFDRSQPLTLSDALSFAGLPSPASADAALRALAIRDLWAWLDGLEQDVSLGGRALPRPRKAG